MTGMQSFSWDYMYSNVEDRLGWATVVGRGRHQKARTPVLASANMYKRVRSHDEASSRAQLE